MSKEFKNLDEQIKILQNKGLTIDDIPYAKEILLRENYFFLNGYRHLFMKSSSNKTYIKGATFEEMYSLFLFDRSFRNILFKNILIIENNVKSIISYQMSLKYGYRERDYLSPKAFTNNPERSRQVNDIIHKMKRQIKNNAMQHSATKHYAENYGYIPFWVLVKVLSFGIIGELFTILKKDDQEAIAGKYNLDVDTFSNYLIMLSNYRNLCAHEDIVYENRTQRKIDDTKYHRLLKIDIVNDEYIYGKNDIFALIIIIRQMLKDDEVKNFVYEVKRILNNLDYNLKTISINKILDRMGLPKNWEEIAEIDNEKVFK